ncbi:hypothetical protein NT03LS_0742 [Listeria seeligeri FSL N1-067]|uniref:Uncharacterized protein n=1 Tax=Listeria seeligeri FSL N1-067 TaxID=702453 RepID=E3ZMU2_LISSE|nr:hypothetical protein NT03LS_0742 [Listeria seeligeri FSL N1-067]
MFFYGLLTEEDIFINNKKDKVMSHHRHYLFFWKNQAE